MRNEPRVGSRMALGIALGAALLACTTQSSMADSPGCPTYASGVVTGKLASGRINEASGIAASRERPGVLWLHNDSGGGTRFYATNAQGQDLGGFTPKLQSAIDLEDIAVGPAPGAPGSFIHLADIGDNLAARANIAIYRLPEPSLEDTAPNQLTALDGFERILLRFPSREAHDAEAFFVDPANGDYYVITKREARVFRVSSRLLTDARKVHTLEEVARLRLPLSLIPSARWVTGADIDFGRNQIAVRTYSRVLLWRVAAGEPIPEALNRPPCAAPVRREPQGEAIGFRHDGRAYWTVSEGRHPPLHMFEATSKD